METRVFTATQPRGQNPSGLVSPADVHTDDAILRPDVSEIQVQQVKWTQVVDFFSTAQAPVVRNLRWKLPASLTWFDTR